MKRLEEINRKIEQLKAECDSVNGTPTEVYSRIVGYYRSVKNWNKGKREEYGHRLQFNRQSFVRKDREVDPGEASGELKVYYFFRKACPNCPPVSEYLASLNCDYSKIDVDTPDGLELSREYSVLSTPTVLAVSAAGIEVFRSSKVKEISSFFEGSVLKAEYVS